MLTCQSLLRENNSNIWLGNSSLEFFNANLYKKMDERETGRVVEGMEP